MEIGSDEDHVHFLVQSVPVPPSRVVQIIKSITAKEIFKHHPEVKKLLWGLESGFYLNTVGHMAMKPSSKSMSKTKEKPINRYTADS